MGMMIQLHKLPSSHRIITSEQAYHIMRYFLISCLGFCFLLVVWRDVKDGSQATQMQADTLPLSHTMGPIKI